MAKKKSARSKRPTTRPAAAEVPGEKPAPATLATLRREIDRLDRELLSQINARAELGRRIAEIKDGQGNGLYAPEREEEILQQVVQGNPGPLSDASVRAVFRELVSGTRAVETPLRVAFLGPEYSYSHLAAIERFGQSAELVPVGSIAAVFEEVERSHAQFGLVPIENSTDGRVADSLDCISRSPVRICGEVPLRIHHCLLGIGERKDLRQIYSKPQALSQCRNWLARHVPAAQLTAVESTSAAARLASENASVAAVASEQAGINHHLKVLARNIEDNPDNVTRFAVISDRGAERTGADNTSLWFEISHEPGALADAMGVFKRNRLNMTWIESFPIPGSRGRYLFFVEFEGHPTELRAKRAIDALRKKAVRLEILGSYARMSPVG